MKPMLYHSHKDNFVPILSAKTNKEGLQCLICNKEIFESCHVEKTYCPACNIHLKYANYLSYV